MKLGKRYKEAIALVDKTKVYEPKEALELLVQTAKAKFDESVELHVKLGVDGRSADQQVRGTVVLPAGTGKTKKVLVIAKGDKAEIAKAEIGEISEEKARETITRYKNSQTNSAQGFGDLLSIGASGITFFGMGNFLKMKNSELLLNEKLIDNLTNGLKDASKEAKKSFPTKKRGKDVENLVEK